MDLAGKAAQALARRSSRRQFFKFMAAGSLGTGLFLTRTGVSVGSVSGGCVGCGGGPCNPCWSPVGLCDQLSPTAYPCKTCIQGGGCPVGCSTSGEWFCCFTEGAGGGICRQRCSECNCPSGCNNSACHCFTMLNIPCTPRLHSDDDPCPCSPPPPVRAPGLAAAHG